MTTRRRVPVWLMGLTNVSYGLYGGAVAFAVPQLLGARHVPEAAIAGLTAVAFSPGFWAFLFSPVLDVRFSRRGYAVALAGVAALTLVVAFLNLANLILLESVLTIGFFAAYLYQSALGGWLASITQGEAANSVSVWITIGNTAGFGIMALGCNQLVSQLAPLTVALILGASVLLPTLVFPAMPAPGTDRRLASESFPQFFGELLALVRQREVLIAICLFVAPAATFSLTNFLGSRGDDFHAAPAFVGLVGGLGSVGAGVAGSLIFPPLGRRMALRPLYLAVGAGGGLCTLALILLPPVPASYAIVVIAENFFQSLAITVSMAVILKTIGRANPLASTTFCVVGSAFSLPLSYMLYVDSFGYARGGIAGSLAIDGLTGIVASAVLGVTLLWLTRRPRSAGFHGL